MRVLHAEFAGACYGVNRALDMAFDVLESNDKASTLGPLIHNPVVVRELESRGLKAVDDASELDGDCVIIRSHGVTPEVKEELEALDLKIVDATCPFVARAQLGAAELASMGCRVLVVGEKGHPEVESLVAYAGKSGAKADVVLSAEQVPYDLYEPVGVVVQTTQTREVLDDVLDELRARGFNPIVKDTICSATQKRQRAAAEIAEAADAMVVLGGKNSSNTTRLAEICAASGTRTFHIESVDELAPEMFADCEVVGVTAGASTPEGQIEDVVSWLEAL